MIRRRPDRRADVQPPTRLVRMAPERTPVRRIHPDHLIAAEDEELLLAVDIDQHRRGGRLLERSALPDERAGLLIERRNPLRGTAERDDDRGVVDERTAGVATARRRRTVLFDEIVRPQPLAGRLVEREQLSSRARRVQPGADDERRRVRAGAL